MKVPVIFAVEKRRKGKKGGEKEKELGEKVGGREKEKELREKVGGREKEFLKMGVKKEF